MNSACSRVAVTILAALVGRDCPDDAVEAPSTLARRWTSEL